MKFIKRRYIIIILIIIISSVLLLSINHRKIEHQKYKDNIFLELAMNGSGYSSTYYIVITKDKVMHVSLGMRERDELGSIPYLRSVTEKGEKTLSDEEFEKILEMTNCLDETQNEDRLVTDSYKIRAYYKQKEYTADYYFKTNKELEDLADEIIDMSPIPIILRIGRQYYIEKQNHYLFQLAILDKSDSKGTYVITVEKNRMLTSYYTFTKRYNVDDYVLFGQYIIARKEKRMLKEWEYLYLKELAEKLDRADNNAPDATEGFHIRISHQFVKYYSDIDSDENPNLLKLTEALMDLSPMPVILQEADEREAYLGVNEEEFWKHYLENFEEYFNRS